MLADKLRKAVLQAAIQGKLTKQLPTDGNAADLVAEIKKEKERLIKEKKIKKQKPLPEITAEEIPFEIPDNWCWVRLGDIMIERGQKKPEEKFSYIDIGSINNKENKLGECKILSPEKAPSRARKLVKIGDIIYSTVRPYLLNTCIIDREIKPIPIVSTGFAVISTDNIDVNKYIFKVLLSPMFSDYANDRENSKGVAYPAINDTKLKLAILPFPPISEQRRIVEKIEEVLNKLNKLKVNEEKLSLLQKNFPDKLKKSLLQAAIQGNLTEQLPTDGNVDDLLAEIRKEKEKLIKEKKIKKQKPLPPITEEEIPFEIPENWRWVRLGEIGKIVGGGTPKTDVLEYWVNGNIPWITPADMKNIKGKYIYHGEKYITSLGLNKSSAQLMPKNSILFSSRAPIGYIAITKNEVSTNQGFKSIVPFNVSLTNYIYYALLALVDNIKKIGTGTTFKEVSGSVVEKIIIPLPPIAEQKRIVKQLDLLLNNVKKLKI